MPDPLGVITQEDLNRRIAEHQKWLKDPTSGRQMMLINFDLSGLEIRGNLKQSFFTGCDLQSVQFNDPELTNSTFTRCNLSKSFLEILGIGIQFSEVDFTGAIFRRADISAKVDAKCTFTDVDFRDSKLNLNIEECDLSTCSMTPSNPLNAVDFGRSFFLKVKFPEALDGVGFGRAIFSSCQFQNTNFARVGDLSNVKLWQTRFTNCDFTGVSLAKSTSPFTVLQAVVFQDCDLTRVDLSGHDLSMTGFKNTTLAAAVLNGCRFDDEVQLAGVNLADAEIRDVRMYKANLAGATLTKARLDRSHLSRADLKNAVMSGAIVSEADLSLADYSGATTTGWIHHLTNFRGAINEQGDECGPTSIGICYT